MLLPPPTDDRGRVDALRALRILDTLPEERFEDIAQLAASLCMTPIAAVNLVDAEREWPKAVVGIPGVEGPRATAFCAQTIASTGGVLEVPDAHVDPRWCRIPAVTGQPWLRFYAGAAVTTSEGHAVGTVFVADHQPRRLSPRALSGLRALARQTSALLELRRQESWNGSADPGRPVPTDPLTGLPGRAVLADRLDQALRSRLRTRRDVGVVCVDVEELDQVNDRHGRPIGDELLRVVAARLASAARGSDTVARIRGARFVLVCPGMVDPRDIDAVGTRVREAVERPVTLRGTSLVPRLSIGAIVATPGEDAEAALLRADATRLAVEQGAAG